MVDGNREVGRGSENVDWTWGTEKKGVEDDSQLSWPNSDMDTERGQILALAWKWLEKVSGAGRGRVPAGRRAVQGRLRAGAGSGLRPGALPGSPGAGLARTGRAAGGRLRLYFQVFRRRLRNVRSVPGQD